MKNLKFLKLLQFNEILKFIHFSQFNENLKFLNFMQFNEVSEFWKFLQCNKIMKFAKILQFNEILRFLKFLQLNASEIFKILAIQRNFGKFCNQTKLKFLNFWKSNKKFKIYEIIAIATKFRNYTFFAI